MNITNDPYLTQLIEERDLNPTTAKLYTHTLTKYCKLHQTTPTKLIESAIKEEEKGIRKTQRRIKKHLTTYRKWMQTQNYSPKTIKTNLTIIRSFYNEYEIELPRLRYKNKHEETLTTSKDIPGKEHIQTILKHANLKYTAIIKLMAQSAMGSAEIRNLTNNDLIKSLEIPEKTPIGIGETLQKLEETDILTWKIRRKKTQKPYFTFSGPESINALIDYLEQRYKTEDFVCDKYLFGKDWKPTAKRSLEGYFIELNDKCGFGFHGRQRFFTSHKLRKYFATTLESSHMPHLMIRWLMGHSIDSVTNAYFKPDIEALKNEYLRVLPNLSIDQIETRTIDSPEVKMLQDQIDAQNKKIESRDEIIKELVKASNVKDRLNELKKD